VPDGLDWELWLGPAPFKPYFGQRTVNLAGWMLTYDYTIGFMSGFPPFIIEAFKSTITEIFNADLVLLVVDSSEGRDAIEMKISTSEKILFPDVELERVFLVLNKIDKIDMVERKVLIRLMEDRGYSSRVFPSSAVTGEGIDSLHEGIVARFSHRVEFQLTLPQTGETESFLTWLRRKASISVLEYSNEVRVVGTCDEVDMKKLRERTSSLRAKAVFIALT